MIRILKLVTNEDILAEISSETETQFKIKKPVAIGLAQNPDGGVGLGMNPWCVFAKDSEIAISKSHVICILEVDPQVVNHYNKNFGSGVIIATPQETSSILLGN